jgi:hypothetical protein
MKITKLLHRIVLYDFPEVLVKLSRKAIWARGLVALHLKDRFSYLILRERSNKESIFFLRSFEDIICSRLIQREITLFRSPKQRFVLFCNVRFNLFITFYNSFLLLERINVTSRILNFENLTKLINLFNFHAIFEFSKVMIDKISYD